MANFWINFNVIQMNTSNFSSGILQVQAPTYLDAGYITFGGGELEPSEFQILSDVPYVTFTVTSIDNVNHKVYFNMNLDATQAPSGQSLFKILVQTTNANEDKVITPYSQTNTLINNYEGESTSESTNPHNSTEGTTDTTSQTTSETGTTSSSSTPETSTPTPSESTTSETTTVPTTTLESEETPNESTDITTSTESSSTTPSKTFETSTTESSTSTESGEIENGFSRNDSSNEGRTRVSDSTTQSGLRHEQTGTTSSSTESRGNQQETIGTNGTKDVPQYTTSETQVEELPQTNEITNPMVAGLGFVLVLVGIFITCRKNKFKGEN